MAFTITSLQVETVTEHEDLRTLRTQLLICLHWLEDDRIVGSGLAIWEVNDDGSINTGDWLKK
jgi:hypothetical protein